MMKLDQTFTAALGAMNVTDAFLDTEFKRALVVIDGGLRRFDGDKLVANSSLRPSPPGGKMVTITAMSDKGQPLHLRMDSRAAYDLLAARRAALQQVLDMLNK